MIPELINWAYQNPLFFLLVLFFGYKSWQLSQPWPDYGGDVSSVHSLSEWKVLQKRSADESKPLMVDCYATWCPPCKTAAPVYARLSEEYRGCIFSKLNVDEAQDVSRQLGIEAMPTFKLFRGETEVGSLKGWQEEALRKLLDDHGARGDTATSSKQE